MSTHRWDGALFRAFDSSGMPDLFPPSEEHGIDYYSDHGGVHYDPVFGPRESFQPDDCVTIVSLRVVIQ